MNKRRHPDWLKVKIPSGKEYHRIKSLLASSRLHTICEEAKCPNIAECFSRGTATFLILGDVCTRNCTYCNVKTCLRAPASRVRDADRGMHRQKGAPLEVDLNEPRPSQTGRGEPERVARLVKKLNLNYVVITSVTRDDLPDGGADIFAQTIQEIKGLSPKTKIEVLIPDFKGNLDSLKKVIDAKPRVLAHNLETVERLFPAVRPQGDYSRSLNLLKEAKEMSPALSTFGVSLSGRKGGVNPNIFTPLEIKSRLVKSNGNASLKRFLSHTTSLRDKSPTGFTKSGIMVGMGEAKEEIIEAMEDLRKASCDIFTIGQYLQPSLNHLPSSKYYTPEEFRKFKEIGEEMGFLHIESGPLVRSSYHAAEATL